MKSLTEILDRMVDEIQQEFPQKSEFEVAFMAIQTHLSVVASMMAMAGLKYGNLNEQELYTFTNSLVEAAQWMAAKHLAAETMREIENM